MRLLQVRTLSIVLAVLVIFQLGALAGQFLGGGRAFADPVGMSVSGGSNPLVTLTGTLTSTSSSNVIYTVPTGKIFVITDISVGGPNTSSGYYDIFRLYDTTQGRYLWTGYWNYYSYNYNVKEAIAHFTSGMALPAGTKLSAFCYNGYTNYYTITGYLARP